MRVSDHQPAAAPKAHAGHAAKAPARRSAVVTLGSAAPVSAGYFAPLVSPLFPQLLVGHSADPAERAADAFADRVMGGGGVSLVAAPRATGGSGILRRKCSACEEEGALRRKASGGGGGGMMSAPAVVHQALAGPAHGLDAGARGTIEARGGVDLSGVRVHTDSLAAESAAAVGARAYTVGQDVVFGAGEYRPGTSDGLRLIAHEVGHLGSGVVRREETENNGKVVDRQMSLNNFMFAIDSIRGEQKDAISELETAEARTPVAPTAHESDINGAVESGLKIAMIAIGYGLGQLLAGPVGGAATAEVIAEVAAEKALIIGGFNWLAGKSQEYALKARASAQSDVAQGRIDSARNYFSQQKSALNFAYTDLKIRYNSDPTLSIARMDAIREGLGNAGATAKVIQKGVTFDAWTTLLSHTDSAGLPAHWTSSDGQVIAGTDMFKADKYKVGVLTVTIEGETNRFVRVVDASSMSGIGADVLKEGTKGRRLKDIKVPKLYSGTVLVRGSSKGFVELGVNERGEVWVLSGTNDWGKKFLYTRYAGATPLDGDEFWRDPPNSAELNNAAKHYVALIEQNRTP